MGWDYIILVMDFIECKEGHLFVLDWDRICFLFVWFYLRFRFREEHRGFLVQILEALVRDQVAVRAGARNRVSRQLNRPLYPLVNTCLIWQNLVPRLIKILEIPFLVKDQRGPRIWVVQVCEVDDIAIPCFRTIVVDWPLPVSVSHDSGRTL